MEAQPCLNGRRPRRLWDIQAAASVPAASVPAEAVPEAADRAEEDRIKNSEWGSAHPSSSASPSTPHTPLSPPTISMRLRGRRARLVGATVGRPLVVRKKAPLKSMGGWRGFGGGKGGAGATKGAKRKDRPAGTPFCENKTGEHCSILQEREYNI